MYIYKSINIKFELFLFHFVFFRRLLSNSADSFKQFVNTKKLIFIINTV